MYLLLVTDITVLFLLVLAIILNAIVLLAFLNIRKDGASLRLLSYLTFTDFLHATAISFYSIYLVYKWNPTEIRMDPYLIMISSTPLILQLKVNLILTVAVAIDRMMALYFPLRYRMISDSKFAAVVFAVAIISGICDVAIEFWLSPFNQNINCAAIGCFVSSEFRFYWGTSNMALGLAVILLTICVLTKLQQIEARSKRLKGTKRNESAKFAQANRTSRSFLLCSLTWLTIPSVLVGAGELVFGNSPFEYVGPFYLVGLLCASTSNCFIYLVFNREIRTNVKAGLARLQSDGWKYITRKRWTNVVRSVTNPSQMQTTTISRQ